MCSISILAFLPSLAFLAAASLVPPQTRTSANQDSRRSTVSSLLSPFTPQFLDTAGNQGGNASWNGLPLAISGIVKLYTLRTAFRTKAVHVRRLQQSCGSIALLRTFHDRAASCINTPSAAPLAVFSLRIKLRIGEEALAWSTLLCSRYNTSPYQHEEIYRFESLLGSPVSPLHVLGAHTLAVLLTLAFSAAASPTINQDKREPAGGASDPGANADWK
ncbi:hypothetical protein EDB83DRAFT_2321491 [Lactarius deliciosus]|nr:hypothetical protein EDB83DRAFT_2321491 [Lactarius deliciosus]